MAQGGPYIDPRGIPDMPTLQDPMGSDVGLAGAKSPVVPAGPDQNQLSNETVDALAAPRSGGGPRLSMDGGGYAWGVGASDFNPNGFKPNESRSTQVGKYGGAPLFAATLGMPTGAVASALQRNAQKQDEIRKAVQQFDPMAGVEDVNAPEYRDSFQRGAMDDIHGYVASVNEQWGDQEGYRRMMTPGSPEHKGLRERGSSWTTVARLMNQSTKSAADLIDGYDKGTLQVPRSLRDDAEKLLRKTGEWSGNQDPTELAKDMKVFTANVSLVDQLKTDGISAVLKNSGSVQKFYDEIKKGYKGPNGETLYHPAYRMILGRKTESYDDAIKGIADSYAEQYKGVLSEEEILKTVRAFAPEIKYEEDVMMDERSLPSSSGASKAGNTGVGTTVRADFRPLDVVGGGRGTNGVFFTPFQTTGDKEHTVKEMTVSSRTGSADTPIRDASLTYSPDRGWVITGRSLSDEGKKALSKITDTGGDGKFGESENSSKEVDAVWNKYRVLKSVPANINSSIVAAYWGDADPNAAAAKIAGMDPAEMESAMKTEEGRAMVAKKMGINTERKNAGSFSTDAPKAAPGYTIGQKDGDYKYKGGDPKDQNSWEKVK